MRFHNINAYEVMEWTPGLEALGVEVVVVVVV
jgi:hypothetical protein